MKNIFISISLKSVIILFFTSILISGCGSEQKTEKSTNLENVISEMKTDLSNPQMNNNAAHDHDHSHDKGVAKVLEILDTERYSYLNVADQNNHKFWMAIPKENIEVGDKITYEGGLLKNNFESKEYNRVFETLYLVSRYQITKSDGTKISPNDQASDTHEANGAAENKAAKPFSATPEITDLLNNPSVYGGKTVTVSGKVVKVNFNIMGKNWVHIQNEKNPGKDFTLTTNDKVMEGQKVSFEGGITLNKDFGAGYKYEIIMEDAKLK